MRNNMKRFGGTFWSEEHARTRKYTLKSTLCIYFQNIETQMSEFVKVSFCVIRKKNPKLIYRRQNENLPLKHRALQTLQGHINRNHEAECWVLQHVFGGIKSALKDPVWPEAADRALSRRFCFIHSVLQTSGNRKRRRFRSFALNASTRVMCTLRFVQKYISDLQQFSSNTTKRRRYLGDGGDLSGVGFNLFNKKQNNPQFPALAPKKRHKQEL